MNVSLLTLFLRDVEPGFQFVRDDLTRWVPRKYSTQAKESKTRSRRTLGGMGFLPVGARLRREIDPGAPRPARGTRTPCRSFVASRSPSFHSSLTIDSISERYLGQWRTRSWRQTSNRSEIGSRSSADNGSCSRVRQNFWQWR